MDLRLILIDRRICAPVRRDPYGITTWLSMVSKCANPKCTKPFVRLDGGQVYGFRITHVTEHFWLCKQCAKLYTLQRKGGEVKLASRKHAA